MDIKAELEDAVYTYREFFRREGIELQLHRLRGGVSPPSPETRSGCGRCSATCWTTPPSTAAPASASTPPSRREEDEVVITHPGLWPRYPSRRSCPTSSTSSIRGRSKARGSGIGLAVCEEIITRHERHPGLSATPRGAAAW
ncbi:MAG: hypothetical protein ACLRWQ_18305 [Flavonifractor plautii]